MSNPDKRNEILSAALVMIAEHGFHGAPIAMIADKARVAVGTIYCHFENKDILITELYKEIDCRIQETLVEGYEIESPIRKRYICLFTKLLNYFAKHIHEFNFIEQFFNSPYGVSYRKDKILGKQGDQNIFNQLFEQGVSQQILKGLPHVILFALTLGPLLAIVRDHIRGFVCINSDLIEATATSCWDAIRR